MKIAALTPTKRPGGLDVTAFGLRRQVGIDLHDVTWIIADDLYDRRKDIVAEQTEHDEFSVLHFDPRQFAWEGSHRCLATAYLHAMNLARDELEADMFVSLQDYIIPPIRGLARFSEIARKTPQVLVSGVMDFNVHPDPSQIADINGMWTIYEEPLATMPRILSCWVDPRPQVNKDRGLFGLSGCEPEWWEANWAMVGPIPLRDERLHYNVEYDRGAAFENQGYSFDASRLGYGIMFDPDNRAVGLDHKRYWPAEEQDDMNYLNQAWHLEKYGR